MRLPISSINWPILSSRFVVLRISWRTFSRENSFARELSSEKSLRLSLSKVPSSADFWRDFLSEVLSDDHAESKVRERLGFNSFSTKSFISLTDLTLSGSNWYSISIFFSFNELINLSAPFTFLNLFLSVSIFFCPEILPSKSVSPTPNCVLKFSICSFV